MDDGAARPPVPRIDGFGELVEIGRGGSSVVYAAEQHPLGRRVAVKVLNVDLGDDAARRRFERECAVVGALGDAPGIVGVHATAFTDDGRACIVMQLMSASLADMMRSRGPLPVDRVRRVGVVAARALAHAHERGVVHRDVKPANLLVSEFGEVALADFDIASVASLVSSTSTQESLSPPHAPPERLAGDLRPGPAGDIWSLGSTLYTLLAGAPPFGTASSDGGMAGLVDRVRNDPVPPLPGRDRAGVAELEAVLLRALAKEPADRFADASAMADALLGLDVAPEAASGVEPHEAAGAEEEAAGVQFAALRIAALPAGPLGGVGAGAPRPVSRPAPEGAGWPALLVIALVVVVAVVAGMVLALR